MPKVTDEHLASRRAEILDGARRAFSTYGYEGATVARLEEETGLSRGAIFHYFDSKLDLFVELAGADNRRYQLLMAEDGLDDVVRAIASESADWLGMLIQTQAKLLHDPEFERRLAAPSETREQLLDAFRERQTTGVYRDDISAEDLARFATMVLNGLALRVASGDPFDVETVVVLLADALRPRD